MRAAIYARYSSENQRPESIEDQISSCRKLAAQRGFVLDDAHIYTDMAASGARKDRTGLNALLQASEGRQFEVLLVDDLSRLARNTLLMLTVLEELRFNGVRVVSVADGLDSDDEEASVGIQVRGVFNELQLTDLRKKTLRGQIGQKQRGFTVGEATYGYRSVAVGAIRLDKKGRQRPEGYRMVIEPREAGVVLRVFREFADGRSESMIVRRMNEEGITGRRCSKGWSAATVHRLLRNEKYVGRWIWNRSQTRRDPKTGRRRQFPKAESEWLISNDETLRIVPPELWGRVQARLAEVRKIWPTRKGSRGFVGQTASRVALYPAELLSGAMVCGVCGAGISKVSGKSGGYYGCFGAVRGKCENKLLVRRTLAERVILAAVRDRLASAENVAYVLRRVEEEVARASKESPEVIRLKDAEFEAESRRIANFIEFAAQGRGSRALADALVASERKRDELQAELELLRQARTAVQSVPPLIWIQERIATLQEVLERRTERSALLLRALLGKIRLEPVSRESGRPYYRALSNLQTLALFELGPAPDGGDAGPNAFHWRRRRDSNLRYPSGHSGFQVGSEARLLPSGSDSFNRDSTLADRDPAAVGSRPQEFTDKTRTRERRLRTVQACSWRRA
jgi:site-specific DNA recombinase